MEWLRRSRERQGQIFNPDFPLLSLLTPSIENRNQKEKVRSLTHFHPLPLLPPHSPSNSAPTARNHPAGARRALRARELLDGAPRQGLRFAPYLKFHPGGSHFLVAVGGKDATKVFDSYHAWVNAGALLASCLVGKLVEGEGGERAAEATAEEAEAAADAAEAEFAAARAAAAAAAAADAEAAAAALGAAKAGAGADGG